MPPLVCAQPSGLTSPWHLKYTVTLQSPIGQAHKHISSIIVGAVLNVQPFLHSWISCLLSITSWAQLASLSRYSRPTVLRATLRSAPHRRHNTVGCQRHTRVVLPCNICVALQPRHSLLSLTLLDSHTSRVDSKGICFLAPTTRGTL